MWTKEQQAVIDSRNSNLLVAAAAGSGKTAVLIERIISLITDKKHEVDIDKLLVVTFTNAAASEMRERVGSALEKALEINPDDKHLQKQMMLLNKAEICTIDSFCGNVVRNNFHVTDLDPNIKMADPTEIEIIASDVMEDFFEEQYEIENEEFLRLVDWYSGRTNDDSLVELILTVNKFINSSPYPEKWLDDSAEHFNTEGKGDEFYISEYLIPVAKNVDIALNNYKTMIETYLSEIMMYEKLEKYYSEKSWKYEKLVEISDLVKECIEMEDNIDEDRFRDCWDNILYLIEEVELKVFPSFRKTKSLPEDATLAYESVKQNFNDMKKAVSEEYDKLKIHIDTIKKENEILYPYMRAISNICKEFRAKFDEKKKRMGIVDFADIEHYALKILTKEENGNILPSDIAINYRNYYSEVFTDEYQDSNLVQEMILSMVSKDEKPNRFMVGDVKQSIYRFRQAMPEIFMSKYETYDLYSDCEENENKKIMLYKNFRSRAEVLEGCNHLFSNIMRRETGELDYTEEERLNPGAEFKELEDENTYAGGQIEVYLLEKKDDSEGSNFKDDESEDDETEDMNGFSRECANIANIIYKMVNPEKGQKQFTVFDKELGKYRPVQYRDIVILMRSLGNKAINLEEILGFYNIPVYSNSGDGYFSTIEVDTMVNLLKIIDNPIQDIPLISVMRSPIFGFDSNELANIRLVDRDVKFYEAILKLCSFESVEECELDGELSTIDLYESCDVCGDEKKVVEDTKFRGYYFDSDKYLLEESNNKETDKNVSNKEESNSEVTDKNVSNEEDIPVDELERKIAREITFKMEKQDILSGVELFEYNMDSSSDFNSYTEVLKKADEEGKQVRVALSGEMRKLQCKAKKFIKELELMREKSLLLSVDEFIWYLLRNTGYYSYVGMLEMGEHRQNNLMLLFERARAYEKTSYKGLFNFINYIDRMKSRNTDLGEANNISEDADVVRIMSIHKSKGLEFPVVIVANSDKKFNMSPDTSSLSLHQTLGYGPKVFHNEKKVFFDSTAKKKIDEKRKKELIAEEMRILYVAMTRAKEKLIFTGMIKSRDEIVDLWRATPLNSELKIDSLSVIKSMSYLNWIMPTIINLNTIREESLNVRGELVETIGYKDCQWSINFDKFTEIKEEYKKITGVVNLDAGKEGNISETEVEINAVENDNEIRKIAVSEDKKSEITDELDTKGISLNKPDDVKKENFNDSHRDSELDKEESSSFLDRTESIFINDLENMLQSYDMVEESKKVKEELDEKFNYKYKYAASLSKPSSISVSEIKKLLSQDSEDEGMNKSMYETKISGNMKTPSFIHKGEDRVEFNAAERGTIFHLVMQIMDFSLFNGTEDSNELDEKVNSELCRMVKQNIISEEEKETVNVKWIVRFMKSEIFRRILEAQKNKKLYKEKAINLSLKMASLYDDEAIDESERIMMVGIIDLFYEDSEGNLVLIDYKTDYVHNENYKPIINKYKVQLDMYQKAMEKISGKKVVKKYLYMFSKGKLLDI